MKFILRFLYIIWQWSWGFIQSLIGLVMLLKYAKCKHEWYHGALVTYHEDNWGGISLGMFVFMNGTRDEEWTNGTRVHEYGHTLQSLLLGPFYMLVIGIPSFIWCNAKKFVELRKTGVSYFDFYPEKWANAWGSAWTKEPAPKR